LDLNNLYGEALFLMAQIKQKKGDINEAEKALKKCLNSNPSKELYARAQEMLSSLKNFR
jgi:tetratricopeptide (TPR) repeat protein